MAAKPIRGTLAALAFWLYNGFVTHAPWHFLRRFYLARVLGLRLGRGVSVQMGCFVTGRHIVIGDRSVVNRGCYLDGRVGLKIGSDVSISPQVCILSLSHDPQSRDFATLPGPVEIGPRCFIGMRALILPGVVLGEGAVVGAGSVVTKSCDAFAIVAGSPARKIGERTRDLGYSLRYFPLLGTDIQP